MTITIKYNLIGRTFHCLTVIKRVRDGKTNVRWLCQCIYGRQTVAVTANLLKGRHKSCGCGRKGPNAFRSKAKTVTNGYVLVMNWKHPRANPYTGRVREHILVMERKLGRRLYPGEEVHHKNGCRSDNRPSNLELWCKSHPAGARPRDLVKWARQILRRYSATTR